MTRLTNEELENLLYVMEYVDESDVKKQLARELLAARKAVHTLRSLASVIEGNAHLYKSMDLKCVMNTSMLFANEALAEYDALFGDPK